MSMSIIKAMYADGEHDKRLFKSRRGGTCVSVLVSNMDAMPWGEGFAGTIGGEASARKHYLGVVRKSNAEGMGGAWREAWRGLTKARAGKKHQRKQCAGNKS
jgi:hypothetical protein